MSSLRRLLATAAATAALTAGIVSLPSSASASAYSAPTALFLTVADGEGGDVVSRAVVLTCDPAGGSHPAAQQACNELAAVTGDIDALSEGPDNCIMIYDPVTVTAEGWWQGHVRSFRATYVNSCLLYRQTRAVFDF
ncbi:MAG: Subtilisin inhibitor-like protein 5 [Dactylosporangium sp.]|jgi:hypothetical protein|nr:Subtilisin inhibitor-like protein 5 [Dactylosporangium sp.]